MKKISHDVFQCIGCGGSLHDNGMFMSCGSCSRKFEVREGIPVLAEKERYWCNVPKPTMTQLNIEAEGSNWKAALARHLKGNVLHHVSDDRRIDFRYLLPSLSDKKVLDIGSMWGGITIPLSAYAKEVCAVDTTYETLKFLSIRAKQEARDNINTALASAYKLPFCDSYFDIALMIGVLEWLGSSYNFVISEDYGKAARQRPERSPDPESLQLKALYEMNRALKPGGTALIAIENRFFYKHFFGYPDSHTAVPFSSVLPRPLANLYMKLLKNRNYEEYTYSYNGYAKILRKAGFSKTTFYAAMPSYRELDVLIPLDEDRFIRYYYENYGLKDVTGIKRLVPEVIVKMNLMKYFVPSFLIFAEK